MIFSKASRAEETKDVLVSIDIDSGMADIQTVQEINHERVLAPGYSVPIGDVRAFTGRKGRIFIVNAPAEATSDYKRIAELERSTVLKQITRYKDNTENQSIDLMKWALLVIVAVMGVVLAFN